MRLIDCFIDSLAYTLELVRNAGTGMAAASYEDVRSHLQSQLNSVEGPASHGGYSLPQVRTARFAVIAFIDEQLVSNDWPGRDAWARNLLQREFYETTNAGVEFFTRLDALNPFNPAELDIREVYYYCLTLGFCGKFYGEGAQSSLAKIKRDNYELLVDESGDTSLFPEALGQQKSSSQLKARRDFTALYYGLPVLLIIGSFFYFRKEMLDMANFLLISV
ncbi:DotU family type IV/VI secretion system protein [Oceanobacter mangrovi]|uniref:DotU family type IV/VI secretion system protein n=1 Tax=Oceanobacter mangrovi TaxID=2862510 RepID=UPI001C8E6383|nr:DotU family type IV/VI secretion system protein [Oceanobacter mangrovi]